ncbi:HAMP domain-containing sensor histidine kinase [Oscillatoria sp. CS-180]|uniref:sensor histidine kinase n=1 Tax=Oscillatoria sp. CS-180 TaxID=3021720 RepID=UPI00232F457B|nr:HAMP domain-containing sensor histidine kinase [Oscillatoria sp. CS-180]MDB9527976.1 HAMP domain-containing sensor histidine kinase [Oscillatoria sp. CS-180]
MDELADTLALSADAIVVATQLEQNAEVIQQVLAAQGWSCVDATTIETVLAAIQAEVSLVIVSEEMLSLGNNFEQLVTGLNEQPEWSDIPIIFLLKHCRRFPNCLAMLRSARYQRSITLLEMPLKRHEFTSIVQTCLSNRQRQFQLRDTLRQLHESNLALESFNHMVAHELRNPLNVVTVSLDLLQRMSLESSEQKLVQKGLQTSRKMNQTLKALLEYGKLESRRNLTFETTDMSVVVEQAVNGLQNIINAYQATVDWTDLPVVQGNAKLLENLVNNLIKNAILHNEAVKPIVMIESESRGDRYHFRVIDNGPGISFEDQQKIFQLFVRVGKSQVEGSGLGLALCQRIVNQHGGTLGVNSELGQGSTFHFDLPRAVTTQA